MPHIKRIRHSFVYLNSLLRSSQGQLYQNGSHLGRRSTFCQVRHTSYVKLFHKLRQFQGLDPVECPRLTPQMVTSILGMNEVAVSNTGGIVKDVQCNQLQANKPIEDRRVEGKLTGTDKYLFGVFDGHAGCACAQNLKERLLQYIAVSMADNRSLHQIYQKGTQDSADLISYLPSTSVDDLSPDLASVHWHSLLNYVNDSLDMMLTESTAKEALISAFMRLDHDISSEAIFHPGDTGLCSDVINIAFSGAVGCVAYIDGLDLYVANVGDTQAVIGSHLQESEEWEANLVTNKHDAQSKTEMSRLAAKHPNEINNIVRGDRLFGELMPLRAFGDVKYKWSKKDIIQLKDMVSGKRDPDLAPYRHLTIPRNFQTPPYLDAEPEVIHYRLSPKDRFLVLASDGLWDSEGMTPTKVVSLIGNHTEGQQTLGIYKPSESMSLSSVNDELAKRKQSLTKRSIDKNVATHLLRHALGLEHGQVSAQLTLPEKVVRFYRDDITITVVYFDQDYIKDFTRVH